MPARDPENAQPEVHAPAPSGAQADTTAARWPLATILVVDDEPGMRNFLLKALEVRQQRGLLWLTTNLRPAASGRRVRGGGCRTRAPSVRSDLVAQNRGDILALAQQPDHIQVIAAFEVTPEQREL